MWTSPVLTVNELYAFVSYCDLVNKVVDFREIDVECALRYLDESGVIHVEKPAGTHEKEKVNDVVDITGKTGAFGAASSSSSSSSSSSA